MAAFDFVRRTFHSLLKKAGTFHREHVAIKVKYINISMRS